MPVSGVGFARIIVLIAAGLFLVACDRAASPPVISVVGQSLPTFSVRGHDNRLQPFNRPKVPLLVLNIWAVWCPPCREEMPSLQRLANAGFQVTGLAVEKDAYLLDEFLRKYRIHFPVIRIAREEAETRLALREYPLTLLIGSNGQILARLTGAFDWNDPAIKKLLLRLMQKQKVAMSEIKTVFLASQKAAAERRQEP
ncbi:Thiol:disulfide oxidoreductase TlpA [hydrothermal vent metagenome]|uniref:Thiol:disulfide oxidoreductase TlpA n=1 Tax=hydrothermal vent metagenome TaxID=652676 RepID=A0A3B1BMB9_9ZZZZ